MLAKNIVSFWYDSKTKAVLYTVHVNKSVGAHKKLRKSHKPVERTGKAVKSLKK